jgi:hypothetical protein
MLVKYVSIDGIPQTFVFFRFVDIIATLLHGRADVTVGYKNQLIRQTGSRNLRGPKTLPTIWGTDMKLVTKYQICVIAEERGYHMMICEH